MFHLTTMYSDQFYEGRGAVLNHKIGKGAVTYIGIDSDDAKLERAVLQKIYKELGETYDLDPGVVIEWRDGFHIGLNYRSDSYEFPIPSHAKILIGEKYTSPAGVVVWKE